MTALIMSQQSFLRSFIEHNKSSVATTPEETSLEVNVTTIPIMSRQS